MKTILGLFAILVSRGMSAAGGIVFSIAVAQTSAAQGLGQMAVFLGLLGVGTIVAKRGMDMLLLKAVAQRDTGPDRADLTPCLLHVIAMSALPSGLVALCIAVLLRTELFGVLDGAALVSLFLIPLAVGLAHVAAYFKGTSRAWLAPLFEIGGISLIATVILVVFPVAPIPSLLASAVCIVIVAAILITQERKTARPALPHHDDVDWRKGRIDFTVIALATFLVSAGSFVLGSVFLDAEALGLLRAAERLALIVSFPVLAIEPYISSRIVRAKHDGNITEMRRTVRLAMIAGGALGLVPALVILAAPLWCLSLMGPGFEGATGYLRTLATLHLAVVVLSPFVTVLNLSGTERQATKINIGVLILGAVLFVVLTYAYAATGFLVAYCAIMLIKIAVITRYAVVEITSNPDGKV